MARQRGNRWQADALVDGKRRRQSFGTEAQADAWAASYAPAEQLPTDTEAETLTGLATSLQRFLWGTGDQATVAMRHVKEAAVILGDISIRTFKTTHVQALTIAYLELDLAPGTINRRYASLSRLARQAVDTDLLDRMPKFKRYKEPEGRKRFLTTAEETLLFGELGKIDAGDEHLAIFLIDTGARLGEAFSLKQTQLDFDATVTGSDGKPIVVGSVTFDKTKADVTRTVFMTQRLRAILLDRKGQKTGPFSDINRWTARDHWNRARKAAGFEHDPLVVPHILRHTCASRIVQAGHGLKLAQTQLGQKNAAMTDRYSHLDNDALSRVVETLERRGQRA